MNGFTIYKEYYELITLLSEKEQQELLLAIMKYMFEDTIPSLNEKQMKVFSNLKRPLDKSKKRSKASSNTTTKLEQNEIKMKSKQNQNEIKTKSKRNQNEIKTKTHQDVNVNVIVNDNVDVNNSGSSYKKNNINNNFNINNLYSYIENNYGRTLSSIEIQKIDDWLKEFNEDLLKYAIQISVMNRKQKFQYVEGILRNWKSQRYKTLQDVIENEKQIKHKDQEIEIFDYDWLNDSDDEKEEL